MNEQYLELMQYLDSYTEDAEARDSLLRRDRTRNIFSTFGIEGFKRKNTHDETKSTTYQSEASCHAKRIRIV